MGRLLSNRSFLARCMAMAALGLLTLAGCAGGPYRYAGDYRTECDPPLAPGESQIERGRRAPVIDTVGWVVGIPGKIFMLDARVDNHRVSAETECRLQQYLAENGLDKVKVRINEYDPAGEWRRLRQNQSVAWPIRYTIGTVWVAGYTLLPGRILGGDEYNPFTNTISIYSDVPAMALYQGGYAKDYAQRKYKGLYAVGYAVPGFGLWQEMQAAEDAMGYIQDKGDPQEIKAGYRTVYPLFGYRAFSPFYIGDVSLSLPGLVGGHVAGLGEAVMTPTADKSPALTAAPVTGAEESAAGAALAVPDSQSAAPPEAANTERVTDFEVLLR